MNELPQFVVMVEREREREMEKTLKAHFPAIIRYNNLLIAFKVVVKDQANADKDVGNCFFLSWHLSREV